MRLSTTVVVGLTSLLFSLHGVDASPAAADVLSRTTISESPLPFNLTYLFTVHLSLGKPLPPIAIPDGVVVTEPIINGTVTGPALNATILGGVATPSVYSNGTIQVPVIQAWGLTSDGVSFLINEAGTGMPKGQITRIEINIGGGSNYTTLRNGYIMASINPNANQTEVAVHGYLVENIASFS